jgi:hypothetical protein
MVPERCPCRPVLSGFVFWSPPKEIAPGPISTRVPSVVSTNQQPDRGTIHCGFGLPCHSPTQPTGNEAMSTVASAVARWLFHCGAARPPMLCMWKADSSQRV